MTSQPKLPKSVLPTMFGEWLRSKLAEQEMSQVELLSRLNESRAGISPFSQALVSRVLSKTPGTARRPPQSLIAAVAAEFHADPDKLLTFARTPLVAVEKPAKALSPTTRQREKVKVVCGHYLLAAPAFLASYMTDTKAVSRADTPFRKVEISVASSTPKDNSSAEESRSVQPVHGTSDVSAGKKQSTDSPNLSEVDPPRRFLTALDAIERLEPTLSSDECADVALVPKELYDMLKARESPLRAIAELASSSYACEWVYRNGSVASKFVRVKEESQSQLCSDSAALVAAHNLHDESGSVSMANPASSKRQRAKKAPFLITTDDLVELLESAADEQNIHTQDGTFTDIVLSSAVFASACSTRVANRIMRTPPETVLLSSKQNLEEVVPELGLLTWQPYSSLLRAKFADQVETKPVYLSVTASGRPREHTYLAVVHSDTFRYRMERSSEYLLQLYAVLGQLRSAAKLLERRLTDSEEPDVDDLKIDKLAQHFFGLETGLEMVRPRDLLIGALASIRFKVRPTMWFSSQLARELQRHVEN